MIEKNFDYLKKQVKFTGFGEGLEGPLKENMEKGLPEFTLQHQVNFGKDEAAATLHFRKSTETENYFFNRYDLTLKREGETEPVRQSFHMGYDNNITFKESYNLLAGRSVYKELARVVDTGTADKPRLEAKGEKYNAWLKMDFSDTDKHGNFKMKQFSDAYGFKLEEALSRHPVKELGNADDKIRLMESLQKGNRQAVTFVAAGREQKHFVEANPQHWSINVYDANMQKVNLRQTRKENEGQQQGEGEKTASDTSKKQGEKPPAERQSRQAKAGKSKNKGQSV